MPALVGLLIIGSLNSDIFSWSRLVPAVKILVEWRFMLAGARKGLMPTAFALVHPENDSPRVAVIFHVRDNWPTKCYQALITAGFSFVGDIESLINYMNIIGILCKCFAIAALVLIKWKKMAVSKEAVKVRFFLIKCILVQFHIFWPILNLVINVSLLLIPFIQEWKQSLVGLGLFLIGCGEYRSTLRTLI